MSKKTIIIISAICAAVVLLGVGVFAFTKVNKNKSDNNPTDTPAANIEQSSTPQDETPIDDITTPDNDVSTPESNTSTPDNNPTTSQNNVTPTQNNSTPSVTTPSTPTMSKSDIVSLYNSSVNRVKSEATTVTRNYKKLESLPEYLVLPSAIQGIGSAAIKQFVKGSDTPESWSTKEEINTVFPVGGTDYSSRLTADMVESASCEDKGNTYQIEIKLYDDSITSPAKGQGYAGVFNTVTASTFDDINIPTVTFNKVTVKGINGSISCTIDKNTKRVTEITFRNADVLSMDVKVAFSNLNAQFALSSEENYTIQY